LINYDGGVSDQLGLTEEYRTRTSLGTPAVGTTCWFRDIIKMRKDTCRHLVGIHTLKKEKKKTPDGQ